MRCNSHLKVLRAADPGASQAVMMKEFTSLANVISLVLHLLIHITDVH